MDQSITIVPLAAKYFAAFRDLNLEWLDRYQLTESHDLLVLDDPQATIIDPGGYCWIALAGDVPVGSAALMKAGTDEFELAKMSVAPAWRGKGISNSLIETCITKARELGAKKICLFSNHQLTAALGLYEKYGFEKVPVVESPFETADVRMEMLL